MDPPDPLDPLDCPVLPERLVVRYVASICCILTLNQRHAEFLDSRVSHTANAPTNSHIFSIHWLMMHFFSFPSV